MIVKFYDENDEFLDEEEFEEMTESQIDELLEDDEDEGPDEWMYYECVPDSKWDRKYYCARCAEPLTPREIEYSTWDDNCPKCGLPAHPVFQALDRLCR